MRERDEQAQQRKYRFTLIRIKFPDGPVLQGTFRVNETMNDVRLFVCDSLEDPSTEFNLVSSVKGMATGQTESASEQTLLALQLCPSAILHFTPVASSNNDGYLKDELMILMQPV